MQPHQQRVVDEKSELDTKAKALSEFIGNSPIFETLDPAEQERLKVQNDVMWQYSEILGARIAAFPNGPTRSEARAAAGFTRRPSLKAIEMRAALELIATPQRPDGTWNRDREACRELAAEALGRYDDSKTPNVGVEPPERSARTTG